MHNIRNFDYRSETDFTLAYYDKTFDLRQLDSVDLVAVYWMGPHIAHIFVSFGFAGQDYLAISIEARKRRGEGSSTVKGFFRQYELYYVVADERDVIRLRTNYRRDPPEQVHIYRLRGSSENARLLFDLPAENQLAKGPSAVLQLAHYQLHDEHLDAVARAVRRPRSGRKYHEAIILGASPDRHDGCVLGASRRRHASDGGKSPRRRRSVKTACS